MTNKEIKIAYIEYESLDQLGPDDRKLADAAIEAVSQSYAPYSNFNVGAAVMFEDGEIISSGNGPVPDKERKTDVRTSYRSRQDMEIREGG